MDATVVPYHWEDSEKFSADYAYLAGLHERLLPRLAEQLNRIHGVSHDVRYWRILIGPWLGLFTQIVFDRWSSVRRAMQTTDISGTAELAGGVESWIPNGMEEFAAFMTGDEWNHRIFSTILEKSTNIPRAQIVGPKRTRADSLPKRALRRTALRLYTRLTNGLVRSRDAFLIATGLPASEELGLQLRLGQLPRFWRAEPEPRLTADMSKRKWIWGGANGNEFEALLLSMIPDQIPVAFLEGYSALISRSRALGWPNNPRIFYSSNALWYATLAMAYAAENAAMGSPIAYAQHGGNYWLTKMHWGESHEVAVADSFFSWGFEDESQSKISAVCYGKPFFRRNPNPKGGTLLLVTHNNPRYNYMMYSGQKGTQVLSSYLKDAFSFVDSLSSECRDQLRVRLTATDYGWGFYERWRERFPELELDRGVARMADLISDARLIICTYSSTAFIEALASDIPAMVFWNPEIDPHADSAVATFDGLEAVGIFHSTPESAAAKIGEIWSDVDAWWLSAPVRAVLTAFRERYCRVSADRVGTIQRALREVIDTSQSSIPEPA